jgi:hypothetical protein
MDKQIDLAKLAQERDELEKAFSKLTEVASAYGLEHSGSDIHNSMLETLQLIRTRFHAIKSALEISGS